MIRFWNKVRKTDGCWLWMAGTDYRYGLFHLDGKDEKAHRVAYRLTHGPIPDGLQVLHHCDTTLCVRPDHLFLGLPADNAHDRDAKGRQRSALGERHGMAKLNVGAVRAIRASLDSDRALAARFGVTPTNIHYVRHRVTWRHVE